ncbi:MAG: hypothetical protein HY670_02060 [Chloroflexi bacterium]|nr:hypothetical protein [Chloroflexota bacterium]
MKPPKKVWTDEEIDATIRDWIARVRPEKVKTGNWDIGDLPFMEPNGNPRIDLWQRINYLDEVEITWGKKWGASGLGKMREAAVVRPQERDIRVPPMSRAPMWSIHAPPITETPTLKDLDAWQKEHEYMCQVLRDHGVTVDYIQYPDPLPIGPYGPHVAMTSIDFWIIWGGAILSRLCIWPLARGREVFLLKWLAEIGCPTLLYVTGRGFCEIGAMESLADDCMFIASGTAANQDGINQVLPVLERAGITNVHIVQHGGWLDSCQFPMGGTYHISLFSAPLDIGKHLVYPPLLGWETQRWFHEHGYEVVEIPPEDHRDWAVSNLIVLAPGKVMMAAEAKETIRRVRKAGVEVIECPTYTSRYKIGLGGSLRCRCKPLIRDPGPRLADLK